jgi:excisionase family DNA binding protein
MELYTVNQIAKLLNVHEKTIRRYINNGRLEARKIGGQWRINQEAYNKLINLGTCCSKSNSDNQIGEDDFCVFMDSDFFNSNEKVQICTIVDMYSEDMQQTRDVLEKLKSKAYDALARGARVKIEYHYEEVEKKARYVIWATPEEIEDFTAVIRQIR